MSESFAELFEESLNNVQMRPGTIINGTVVEVRNDAVVVYAGLKSEGVIPIDQFLDDAGHVEVHVGDVVEVALDAVEDGFGETLLSREKAKRAKAWAKLEHAFESDENVTGLITGKVKGGFTVELDDIRAFLPGSLVDVCIDAVDAGIDHMSLGAVLRHGRPDLHIEPCRAWHAAGPWQALRDESDHIAEERGRRPSALMANLGSLSSHIARSTWTRNLLAAAGIEAIDTESFETAEAAATRWKETEADLAVICGSDATYETMLGEAVDALKAAGCDLLYVSGRLGDKEAELQSAGVVGFLFEGADALSLMEAVHEAVRNTQDE